MTFWKKGNCGYSGRSVVARDWGDGKMGSQNTGFLGDGESILLMSW